MITRMKPAWLLLISFLALLMVGCSQFGKVEQGRVIAYDHQRGLVTIIRDSAAAGQKSNFDVLPPLTVKTPQDPSEMGPLPAVGKRLLFDTQNNRVVFFDTDAGIIKSILYRPIEVLTGVASDDPRLKGLKFPVIDRSKKTISIYSSSDKKLVTFTVTDQDFSLPEDTWKAGDVVRYYYKDPGQALRLMNVTKTNIMKG